MAAQHGVVTASGGGNMFTPAKRLFMMGGVVLENILADQGDFENADLSFWVVLVGSPSVSADYFKTGSKSLKCSGIVSQALRKEILPNQPAANDKLYGFCYAKVTAYVQGNIGIRFIINGSTAYEDTVLTGTSDWAISSLLITYSSGTFGTDIGLWNAGNATAYVDSAMIFNLTKAFGAGNEPSKATMDTFMQLAIAQGYFAQRVYGGV
jgi:hypothetical protein